MSSFPKRCVWCTAGPERGNELMASVGTSQQSGPAGQSSMVPLSLVLVENDKRNAGPHVACCMTSSFNLCKVLAGEDLGGQGCSHLHVFAHYASLQLLCIEHSRCETARDYPSASCMRACMINFSSAQRVETQTTCTIVDDQGGYMYMQASADCAKQERPERTKHPSTALTCMSLVHPSDQNKHSWHATDMAWVPATKTLVCMQRLQNQFVTVYNAPWPKSTSMLLRTWKQSKPGNEPMHNRYRDTGVSSKNGVSSQIPSYVSTAMPRAPQVARKAQQSLEGLRVGWHAASEAHALQRRQLCDGRKGRLWAKIGDV